MWLESFLFVLTLTVACSPWDLVQSWSHQKSSHQNAFFPFLMAPFSSMLWIIYGQQMKNEFLTFTNTMTFFIGMDFLAMYIHFYKKSLQQIRIMMALAIFICFECIYLQLPMQYICVLASLLNTFSPLVVAKHVITTKNSSCMSKYLTLLNVSSTTFWTIYGFAIHDAWIGFVNMLNLILAITQLFLYFIFENKKPVIIIEV